MPAILMLWLLCEKVEQVEKTWWPYWQRLADRQHQAIEEAHVSCRQYKKSEKNL